MRLCSGSNIKRIVVVIFVFFVAAFPVFAANSSVPAGGSANEPQQMLDFNLAGYGTAGQKTWEVQGASMDMEGNEVKINDITAHLYGEKENMVLTADHGRFDKDTGIVYLKDNVRAVTDSGAHLNSDTLDWSQNDKTISTKDQVHLTKDNMTATSQGIEAKPDFKVAEFKKDVVLTVAEDKKAAKKVDDTSPFGKGKMIITCDGPMEMNYDKGYAIFQNRVKVESEESAGAMTADKMTVYFSAATKQIDRMVATGHVKIIRGENISTSDNAVFTASDKRLVLTGHPQLTMYTQEDKNVSP